MPNLRIIHDNAADRATTLAASTTAGTLVAANMQNDRKQRAHRSTGTSVTYTMTWTNGESVGGAALPASNLTADATARVRLYSDTAGVTLIADSGFVYACPGAQLGVWDWTQPLNANAFAYGGASKSAVWLDAHYFAKRCVIDLVDAANPAGYIDCARLVVGGWWSPQSTNASYGAQVSREDSARSKRTQAGDNPSDRGFQFDKMSLDLKYMKEADRAALMRIVHNVGTSRNLFLSMLPANANPVAEQNHMIYGKRANAGVPMDFYDAYSNRLEMEGW